MKRYFELFYIYQRSVIKDYALLEKVIMKSLHAQAWLRVSKDPFYLSFRKTKILSGDVMKMGCF